MNKPQRIDEIHPAVQDELAKIVILHALRDSSPEIVHHMLHSDAHDPNFLEALQKHRISLHKSLVARAGGGAQPTQPGQPTQSAQQPPTKDDLRVRDLVKLLANSSAR